MVAVEEAVDVTAHGHKTRLGGVARRARASQGETTARRVGAAPWESARAVGSSRKRGRAQRSCPSPYTLSAHLSLSCRFAVVAMSQFRKGFMRNWFAIEVRLLPVPSFEPSTDVPDHFKATPM